MAVRHASEKNEAICRPDYIFHLTCFAGCLDGFGECQNAEHLGRSIARKGWIVVTGGGAGGLTGIVARAVNHHGGRVYGVSLAALDPRPHDFFTEFECYQEFDARQRRLFELGDAYLALPGGIDTLHQVLHACVLNLAGPLQKPVILVGDHFLNCSTTYPSGRNLTLYTSILLSIWKLEGMRLPAVFCLAGKGKKWLRNC